jgi:hypothetical protein
MATINTGSTSIAAGEIVQAEHVLPIVKALTGQDATDIVIGGNVTFGGSGVVFNTENVPLSGGGAYFTSNVAAKNFTATVGISADSASFSSSLSVLGYISASALLITNLTASRVSASTEVVTQNITGSNLRLSNTLAFTGLGTIITGSGSVPILTHTVTQSGAVGNGLTFGGSQFRNYLFYGATSPRIGVGASTAITTASLASGSFLTGVVGLTNQPATLLITSSDDYVMKVATNAKSQSFSISGSGFVGINTWTPREALDVQGGNLAVKNPATTSGSIFYVENLTGRVLDVTNNATNSILTVQNISGVPIFDVGVNSSGGSYVAVTGNGGGITAGISSSFAVISGSMSLTFTTGSTVAAGANDLVVVATGNVTLPTAPTAGVGRYYIVKNSNPSTPITVSASPSIFNGPTVLSPTSASRYISDGINTWYSL